MTKKFTLLQLFSLADGRLSTTIEDVYDMLNHICDTSLMTHHLPVAMDYVKEKNPKWLKEVTKRIETINRLKKQGNELPFKALMGMIERNYNDEYDIPQLKDEFDTSDFADFMVGNSLLLKKK